MKRLLRLFTFFTCLTLYGCAELSYIPTAKLLNTVNKEGSWAGNGGMVMSRRPVLNLEVNYSPIKHIGLHGYATAGQKYNDYGGAVGYYYSLIDRYEDDGVRLYFDAYLGYGFIKSSGKIDDFTISDTYSYKHVSQDVSLQLATHFKYNILHIDIGYRPHYFDLISGDYVKAPIQVVEANLKRIKKNPVFLSDLNMRIGLSYEGFGIDGYATIPTSRREDLPTIADGSIGVGMFFNLNGLNIFSKTEENSRKNILDL